MVDSDRVCESDMVGPALRLLASSPSGFMRTSDLIDALAHIFNPTGRDAETIPGRSDTYFSQKVRNLISHRDGNFISEGLAEYRIDDHGLAITAEGRKQIHRMRGVR